MKIHRIRGTLPPALLQLDDVMKQYGWICTGVPGKAMYTVGLLDVFGHPEMMVHGLNPNTIHGLLVQAVESQIKKGYRFEPGIHDNIAEGYPAKLIEVD